MWRTTICETIFIFVEPVQFSFSPHFHFQCTNENVAKFLESPTTYLINPALRETLLLKTKAFFVTNTRHRHQKTSLREKKSPEKREQNLSGTKQYYHQPYAPVNFFFLYVKRIRFFMFLQWSNENFNGGIYIH